MTQVTLEYMIMIPLLILQIFLFPLVANAVMDSWNDSRRDLQLQETAAHFTSTIQQLYYTINHASMNGSVTIHLDIPLAIEQYPYKISLSHAPMVTGGYEVMNVTLNFISVESGTSTIVTLGNNVDWQNLNFNSTQANLILTAAKTADQIMLTAGGD